MVCSLHCAVGTPMHLSPERGADRLKSEFEAVNVQIYGLASERSLTSFVLAENCQGIICYCYEAMLKGYQLDQTSTCRPSVCMRLAVASASLELSARSW